MVMKTIIKNVAKASTKTKKRKKMTDAEREQKRLERNAKNRLSPEEKARRAAAREAAKEEKKKLARKQENRKKVITNTKKRNKREQAEYEARMKVITGRLKNRKKKTKQDGSATDESTFRKNQARGSFNRAQNLERNSMEELADTYDKMLKGSQRAERLKKNSRFLPLFEKRGYANISKKAGGPIVKRKRPGTTKPDWMKGLSEDRIKEMLGGPKPSGERRTKKKQKKKPTQVAKVTVKKIPTVPMDPNLSATFRVGGKGGTKSRSKKTYGKKAGGPVIKKKFGQIIGKIAKKAIGGSGSMSKKSKSKIGKGKPVVKKMGGGQVLKYKKGTGSKTIKGRMSGNDVVAGCYD
mgnify:CR=1 FL=1